MHNSLIKIILSGALVCSAQSATAKGSYGSKLCSQPSISCINVQKGDTWHSLWPNAQAREVVMRLNRMNTLLRKGMRVAVPDNLHSLEVMDIAPFLQRIDKTGNRIILVSPKKLAFGAYDEDGRLVHWGPISGGKSWCPDVGRGCKTIRGQFSIYNTRGPDCVSYKYPLGKGGAPMPHCMFFHRGFAVHGSLTVPGYHASHGCVRVYPEDARWLYDSFITTKERGAPATHVIVQPYT